MMSIKNKKLTVRLISVYMMIGLLTLAPLSSLAADESSKESTDSAKLDQIFNLVKSLDARLNKLEEKPGKDIATEAPAAEKTQKTPTKGTISQAAVTNSQKTPAVNNAFAPGWIVKVYEGKSDKKKGYEYGNRLGAFIAESLPITLIDHKKNSQFTGEPAYKISGYLKISHSESTTFGMRLMSDIVNRYIKCYAVSLKLEDMEILKSVNFQPGLPDAPKIVTGTVDLEPGHYKISIDYACTGGRKRADNKYIVNSFDIAYMTDSMMSFKAVSSDMMFHKVMN
jgi:hypothetical protein